MPAQQRSTARPSKASACSISERSLPGPSARRCSGSSAADVIKANRRPAIRVRRLGTDTEGGDTLMWLSEGRQ
jgi:hypothetical protein